jgi:hypothetical protein
MAPPVGFARTPLIVSCDVPVPTASNCSAASRPDPEAPDFVAGPDKRKIDAARGCVRIRREDDVRSRLPQEAAFLHRSHSKDGRVVRDGQRDGRGLDTLLT